MTGAGVRSASSTNGSPDARDGRHGAPSKLVFPHPDHMPPGFAELAVHALITPAVRADLRAPESSV
jgi:hypothetical protein